MGVSMYTVQHPLAAETKRRLPRESLAIVSLILIDYLVVAGVWFAVARAVNLPASMLNLTIWVLAAVWILAYWREDLYPGYKLTQAERLRAYSSASTLAGFFVLLLMPLVTPVSIETYVAVGFIIVAAAALTYGIRLVSQRLLLRLRLWGRPVLVYGTGATGIRAVQYLKENPLQGLRPVAFVDDQPSVAGTEISGLPVIGNLDAAEPFAKTAGISHLVVANPVLSEDAILRLTSIDAISFKHLQFVPDLPALPLESVRTGRLGTSLTLEVHTNLRLPRKQVAKRAFDLVSVGVGGIVIAPLCLLIALLIWLESRGSVLYSQVRVGKDGSEFKIWKFRSMVHDADARLEAYLESHPEKRAEWEASFKLSKDPRVTKIGRFLRKTSLDELPQLLNVLRGEMSLVGPRPIVAEEIPRYGKDIHLYYLVRPGMTGYWQVSGRSDTSYTNRVSMDAYYVRNWSVWLDMIILVSTIRVVLLREGAY